MCRLFAGSSVQGIGIMRPRPGRGGPPPPPAGGGGGVGGGGGECHFVKHQRHDFVNFVLNCVAELT